MLTANQFQRQLLGWFDQHGRKNLPWQQNKTPYRVWVSEIMLQQTQVATVIPYYERFMREFPTLKSLAAAELDTVLHLWTGLGYYSRAKNLHQSARMILSNFKGKWPNTLSDLTTLPGIGASTAGAIIACAFNQRATILDGNVKRVLTRLYGITSPINEKDTENKLWALATTLTPANRVADYTQAMMDLGATLCTQKKPKCDACPIKKQCKALKANLVDQLPQKIRKKTLPIKTTTFLILQHREQILLEKRTVKGVWQGLWSFPELETPMTLAALKKMVTTRFALSVKTINHAESFRHTFSHYHLDITPIQITINKLKHLPQNEIEYLWYNLHEPNKIGLPQPVKRLLDQLTHATYLL